MQDKGFPWVKDNLINMNLNNYNYNNSYTARSNVSIVV